MESWPFISMEMFNVSLQAIFKWYSRDACHALGAVGWYTTGMPGRLLAPYITDRQ